MDFEGGLTIFIEFLEMHHSLMGATAPTSLCLGPPLRVRTEIERCEIDGEYRRGMLKP